MPGGEGAQLSCLLEKRGTGLQGIRHGVSHCSHPRSDLENRAWDMPMPQVWLPVFWKQERSGCLVEPSKFYAGGRWERIERAGLHSSGTQGQLPHRLTNSF